MNTYNEVSHKREMERLEQAILNHHVHIGAVKQESVIMQAVVDTIEIYDQRLLALILEFARNNYVEHLGFQGLFESKKFSYVTCSTNSYLFYKFAYENNFNDDENIKNFLLNGKKFNVEFFDISFPEDFLD